MVRQILYFGEEKNCRAPISERTLEICIEKPLDSLLLFPQCTISEGSLVTKDSLAGYINSMLQMHIQY